MLNDFADLDADFTHCNPIPYQPSPLLHPMSSQEQTCALDEDWKGVIDPALWKKLQNKLNQRAVRTLLEIRDHTSCSLFQTNAIIL